MAAILKISRQAPGRPQALGALREAGIGVIEVGDWTAAADALRDCSAALVFCDDEVLEGVDAEAVKRAVAALGQGRSDSAALPPDLARTLSHELRTPLSAMAGWLHLMESGNLDGEGMKRAIKKLRGNIDDQVRMIDRYLGSNTGRS